VFIDYLGGEAPQEEIGRYSVGMRRTGASILAGGWKIESVSFAIDYEFSLTSRMVFMALIILNCLIF
jgi:hypothetical protein